VIIVALAKKINTKRRSLSVSLKKQTIPNPALELNTVNSVTVAVMKLQTFSFLIIKKRILLVGRKKEKCKHLKVKNLYIVKTNIVDRILMKTKIGLKFFLIMRKMFLCILRNNSMTTQLLMKILILSLQ
jgi:hypothetical protein